MNDRVLLNKCNLNKWVFLKLRHELWIIATNWEVSLIKGMEHVSSEIRIIK